jgi:hypothetical protein
MSMLNVDSQCNLGDVAAAASSQACTREDFLLDTIVMPKNFKQLTDRLPKSNYGDEKKPTKLLKERSLENIQVGIMHNSHSNERMRIQEKKVSLMALEKDPKIKRNKVISERRDHQ